MTLYVAPDGNDAWSGTLDAPNAGNTDGPLATLTGARDTLRVLRGLGMLTGPAEVQIRGGEYPLTAPVDFAPQDSGTSAAPITFMAYPNEKPVFVGGVRITNWTQSGPIWTAQAPAAWGASYDFMSLWVNGKRAIPARTPNATNEAGDYPTDNDFYFQAGQLFEDDGMGGQVPSATRFQYRNGDLQNWATLNDAHVVVFHAWATSLLRVANLDQANHIVEFTGPAGWEFGRWRSDQWYYVEHLLEGLDQPGEWHVDRANGLVSYMPRDGEDMTTAEVIAPVASQLLRLQGNPAAGQFVSWLTFRGIAFKYTHLALPAGGMTDGQAASGTNAAIEAMGARNCTIDRCEVMHTGGYGVWWRRGSQDNTLSHSEIYDLGAGGVRVGETTTAPTADDEVLRNVVDNNYIHDGGRILRSGVGVWIGRSSYNTVSHNDISDFRFTGVSAGWQWNYLASSAHDNIVEYNHIYECGKQQLNDVGGVYTLGVSPGTIVRNNRIHDIFSNPKLYGGWGLYTDEGSSDITFENNVVYNTETGGFHQHYGQYNIVRNNILAFSRNAQVMRTVAEPGLSFTFERNIVYFNGGTLLGDEWSDDHFAFDYNVYWDAAGRPLDFGGRDWTQWRTAGMDLHSMIANPLFADPDTADFDVGSGSPAISLGFVPIDDSTVGLYGEQAWVDKPKDIVRDPFEPPDLSQIHEDFETTALDSVALNAGTHGETETARVRVTDELAHAGVRSLKFVDEPGLPQTFYPYVDYTPITTEGIAHGTFALRFSPGTLMYHEWRDNHVPYRLGPNVWIDAAGNVKVNGVAIMSVPADTWIVFEITCGLGYDADGTFDLDITVEGQEAVHFDGLACGTPDFNRINWFGFVSDATWAQTFYIDDIHLQATTTGSGPSLPIGWEASAALSAIVCAISVWRIVRH
ncbi:MAG: right-handed parallel beta-helix repeat-containing protein [Candidatus Hydrogenedentes bacterium]|nr:right-handed parallel beta-helix repeat-containing protein [Candidatus Hydrogenedentota bacterium]